MRMYSGFSIGQDGVLIVDTNRALMDTVAEIGYCENGARQLRYDVKHLRSESEKNRAVTGLDSNELVDAYHDVIDEIADVIEKYHKKRVAIKEGVQS